MPTDATPPPAVEGLLDRLDVLVELVVERRGLALDPRGGLAPAEARLIADAVQLDLEGSRPPRDPRAGGVAGTTGATATPGASPPRGRRGDLSPRDLAAVELLRAMAEAVGLVRDRGDRLEVTSMHHPWSQLAAHLRAGLVYAAWCSRVPWSRIIDARPTVTTLRAAKTLHARRADILRLLYALDVEVEIELAPPVEAVALALGLPDDAWLLHALTAVFLDPLVALGVATLDPPSPHPPVRLRLEPECRTVIGSALLAAGDHTPVRDAEAG